MKAEITYTVGRSYKLGSFTFLQGKTLIVHNPKVIQRCQCTVGFSVRILDDIPPASTSAPVKEKAFEVKPKSKLKKAVQPIIEESSPPPKRRKRGSA